MAETKSPLWADGPGELLRHGVSLLANDSDPRRRIAMILIDNSVELMLKTYLGLPKRITKLVITRKELDEAGESFPKLIEAAERHLADRLVGIELSEIEWFHRLRNQLYHDGNGLTVEREKVETYAGLARLLFKNLFGAEVQIDDGRAARVGEFMEAWLAYESALSDFAGSHPIAGQSPRWQPVDAMKQLVEEGVVDRSLGVELEQLRRFRNQLVHGQVGIGDMPRGAIDRLCSVAASIRARSEKKSHEAIEGVLKRAAIRSK